MKKTLAVLLSMAILFGVLGFAGCSKKTQEINVYNWGEYISDGAEDTMDVVAEFEALTGIKVNYTTYASNEDLYAKLKSGGASYDVIIPSDYMIARLIKEGLVQKLDFNNIPNYSYISDEYKNLYFDPENAYSVPYTGGMVGLIYNTTMVQGTPDSWNIMWDATYEGQILTFNNPRDAFGIAQYLLGQSVNTANEADWRAAADKLIAQKPMIQSYVMDEVFDAMERGEAAIAAYYAGDFLTMADVNPDLAFVYPKEGTNIFVDSMCIPTNAKNKEAAEMFINYMCDPDVALANAEYLCYLCPNTAVLEDERYSLKGNPVLYPSQEVKAEYFHDLDQTTLDLMTRLWEEVKLA